MVISPFSIGYVVRKPPLDHDYLMGDMGDAGEKTIQALHGDYISCILGTQPLGYDIATTDDIDLRYKKYMLDLTQNSDVKVSTC